LKTGKKNLFCEAHQPKYVKDTQGWWLITICVKVTRDGDILRVWDEWSRLAPSK